MANSCHTPDAAYALLYGQKIDIESKLAHSKAKLLKQEASKLKALKITESRYHEEYEKLEAQAELLELEADKYIFDMNIKGAEQELAHILSLMEELEPQRKYAHLDILEANEACQRDELLGEMKFRAENSLLSLALKIPTDQLSTMRTHPDFTTHILPHIKSMLSALSSNSQDAIESMLKSIEKPLLLGAK